MVAHYDKPVPALTGNFDNETGSIHVLEVEDGNDK